MRKNQLYEALKAKAALENKNGSKAEMSLGDAARVKVLSPSALVFKRFIRNKLAIVGSCILIFMFLFAFVGPLIYPYRQTEIFYKYDYITATYAGASERTTYTGYKVPDNAATVPDRVQRMMDSSIASMNAAGKDSMLIMDGEQGFVLSASAPHIYLLSEAPVVARVSEGGAKVAKWMKMSGVELLDASLGEDFKAAAEAAIKQKAAEFEFNGASYQVVKVDKISSDILGTGTGVEYTAEAPAEGFEEALTAAMEAGSDEFEFGGEAYFISDGVICGSAAAPAMVYSTLVFNAYDVSTSLSNDERAAALMNAASGEAYALGGHEYRVEDNCSDLLLYRDGSEAAMLSNFVVRDPKGNDTFDLSFKGALEDVIRSMQQNNLQRDTFTYSLPLRISETDENGDEYMVNSLDENGNQIYADTEITVTLKTGQYVATCQQLRHLIDLNGAPSAAHPFGTDGDGMDILARMMYGGRISLMVGFVVVILETLLGVIMGGIAGYFGGWVDNLIMRLVDIFYCIPSMPILIIMGAFMDSMKVSAYTRLIYMMAILGVLGWASVARLVRGQILSLREQEFMVAAEATGLKVRRRIFRHLVPNVMPQLIVSATAGLGSVILTESTLSFLGLGVKHPLATWGTMINSVTSTNENMIRFTYIWVPVGLLICLTVVAFNFVGDGLRDAFDPKMKR